MRRLTPLTLDEHRALGAALTDCRNRVLLKALTRLGAGYGVNSFLMRQVNRALDAIDKLRCELDNRIHAENPGHRLVEIYYGAGRCPTCGETPEFLSPHSSYALRLCDSCADAYMDICERVERHRELLS